MFRVFSGTRLNYFENTKNVQVWKDVLRKDLPYMFVVTGWPYPAGRIIERGSTVQSLVSMHCLYLNRFNFFNSVNIHLDPVQLFMISCYLPLTRSESKIQCKWTIIIFRDKTMLLNLLNSFRCTTGPTKEPLAAIQNN